MTISRSSLFLVVAFVLALFAVITYAAQTILGVPGMVWVSGSLASFYLANLVG